MIGFDEAVALIADAARPLGREKVPIAEAVGCAVAAPVIAGVDSPPQDVSTMDGYAARDADLAHLPARLRLIGESFAGRGFEGQVEPGQCVRIFTGAPVTGGADRVIIQEVVRREGDLAIVEKPPGDSRYIRQSGSDFRRGETLVRPGTRLGPRAILTVAAGDADQVEVWRRPRIAVLATGDELVAPGEAASHAGSIPDSVSLGVAALVAQWGSVVVDRVRLADDLPALEAAAARLLANADIVVVAGGASVGERDYAKAMFAPHGLELIFSNVAIKPGKPVWFGCAGERLVLGLPGNPTSALVTARLFLAPLVTGLGGGDPAAALRWRRAALSLGLEACGERETFVRAAADGDMARPLPNQDSGAQKMLADANLLVRRRPHAAAAQAGEEVELIDF